MNPTTLLRFTLLFVFALPLLSGVRATAATYYVDNTLPAASDGNTGLTTTMPWKTLGYAAAKAVPGDTVCVNGTYVESVAVTQNGNGRWLTFKSYPHARPKIVATGQAAFNITNASYIRFTGFDVTVLAANTENGVGVGIYKSHHVEIENVIAHDCGQAGISAGFSDYMTITGNTVTGNCHSSQYDGSGISLYQDVDYPSTLAAPPASPAQYHNLIANNLITNNQETWTGGNHAHTDGNGIILDDCKHTQATNGDPVPKTPQLGGCVIENNICYANGGRGINIFESSDAFVINNTCVQNQADPALYNAGELSTNTADNVGFYNNIADSRNTGRAAFVMNPNNVVLDYNLYHNGAVTDQNAKPVTLGAHDIIGDPLLSNPGAGTFAPTVSSPAIDTGTPGTFTNLPAKDYAGHPRARGNAVDIGAHESMLAKTYPASAHYYTAIEAESAANQTTLAPFTVQSDPGASGGQYLVNLDTSGSPTWYQDPGNWYSESAITPGTQRAQYTFTTKSLEPVSLWLRVWTDYGAQLYMSLDSGDAASAGSHEQWSGISAYGAWTWVKWKQVDLAAGPHLLKITNGQVNVRIDKILITNDGGFTPSGP